MSKFVSIDVETANSFMGSICQIGAVRFSQGRPTEEKMWLVDPKTDFDEINISIHGIDEERVRGCPAIPVALGELREFIEDDVAVCHTHFDRVAIAQACEGHQLAAFQCRWLDSARVARRTWTEVARRGYGLAALAARHGIEFRHHDALEDARAAGLILHLALAESSLSIEDWLDQVERSITPAGTVTRTGEGDGPLLGECIVFTGALAMPRAQAADRAASLGADVGSTVSKKTTIVVVGDQDLDKLAGHSKSSKHRKAEKMIVDGHPIRILAECDFNAF
ncbi:exonuclease domain-containing protein [Qipengyuania huizhouensis]|uniref:exonuclease domain-containing protein n=1 Tax=Qipengyuania huizhouensis TaxID=2867245 RepID=UPI001C872087|nr:exonuclease domain-containing protein [Qipengyuania huizhouensis]MBX7459528.1 hypothetical protein [Qipengyuania huizhouensis]